MTRKSFGFIAILLLLFAHTGCSPKVAGVTTNATTTSNDSTSSLVTERLVPVNVPGDTLVYFAEVDCPDGTSPAPIKADVTSKRSSLAVSLKSSQLSVTANCNEWLDMVKVRDAEISRLKTVVASSDSQSTIPVKYIPKIYIYAMWFSCIMIGGYVLKLAWKLASAYYKIQLPFKIPFL